MIRKTFSSTKFTLVELLLSMCKKKKEPVDQLFKGSEVVTDGDEYLKGILKST